MVDILDAGTTYTTFGFEPFTPNNELRYKTFQLQDNFTWHRGDARAHVRRERRALRVGERLLPRLAERLHLQLARRLLHRRERLPRQPEPHHLARHAAPLPGALDEHPRPRRSRRSRWRSGTPASTPRTSGRPARNLKVTYGLRLDVPGLRRHRLHRTPTRTRSRSATRAAAPSSTRPASCPTPTSSGRRASASTGTWTATANTQVRGGTGIFTGPPGVRLDLEPDRQHRRAHRASSSSTTRAPGRSTPIPSRYKPTNVTGAPASSYELALTDAELQVPTGVAQQPRRGPQAALGHGRDGSSASTTRDVNGIYYINANLPAAQTSLRGRRHPAALDRPTASTPTSSNAVVLKNQNEGYAWNSRRIAREDVHGRAS